MNPLASMTRTSSALQRMICKALDAKFLHKFYGASSLLPPQVLTAGVTRSFRLAATGLLKLAVTKFLLIFPCTRRAHSGGSN